MPYDDGVARMDPALLRLATSGAAVASRWVWVAQAERESLEAEQELGVQRQRVVWTYSKLETRRRREHMDLLHRGCRSGPGRGGVSGGDMTVQGAHPQGNWAVFLAKRR